MSSQTGKKFEAETESIMDKSNEQELTSGRLIELAFILSQQNDLDEIFRVVAQKTTSLLNAEIALILMVNPSTKRTVKTMFKEGLVTISPRYRAIQNQVSGWIMMNNQPLLTADIKIDTRFSNVQLDDVPIKSVLGVPLRIEGMIIGSIILFNKRQGGEFSQDDLDYLEQIAVISAPYLRNVEKLQHYFIAPLLESTLLKKYEKFGLIGKSQKFLEMLKAIDAAARCDVRVLLEGQSGTGKELIAKAIHKVSDRSQAPFIAIDCGAIPSNLIESELFGHVKGAFTGAIHERTGLFEEANHGTLFMDEIENLPFEMQSKLMRVLQENEIRPVGSNKTRMVDVRIISASSASLHRLVEIKDFREDLYYRLYVYPIAIPSLIERQDDIPILANHFLKRFSKQQNKQVEKFNTEIIDYMKTRQWGGNIRELENFVERLVTLASPEMKILNCDILPEDLKKECESMVTEDDSHLIKSLTDNIAEYEKKLIHKALVESDWNQSKAARTLKIPVQTLRYRMNKLGIGM